MALVVRFSSTSFLVFSIPDIKSRLQNQMFMENRDNPLFITSIPISIPAACTAVQASGSLSWMGARTFLKAVQDAVAGRPTMLSGSALY